MNKEFLEQLEKYRINITQIKHKQIESYLLGTIENFKKELTEFCKQYKMLESECYINIENETDKWGDDIVSIELQAHVPKSKELLQIELDNAIQMEKYLLKKRKTKQNKIRIKELELLKELMVKYPEETK